MATARTRTASIALDYFNGGTGHMTDNTASSRLTGIGLAPRGTFSGFENSFFAALRTCNVDIEQHEVDSAYFKLLATLLSVRPSKKSWALARDRYYHTTASAFRVKSRVASRIVSRQEDSDFVYQIGALWNPLAATPQLPLFLQVDYTSRLSEKRGSEWRRRPGREARFWHENEKRLYDQSARIFTTTENARHSIIHDYGIAHNKVVKVGCGVSAPYSDLSCTRIPAYDAQKILFVGKGFHGKGLDTLLEAFAIVRQRLPQAILTVVGPTGFHTDQQGVNYLGRIRDPQRVRELYFEHSVFAMPSRFEPLGQVFLEAMACKLPCIGTTVDAMPELIDDGVTGCLISPGNVAQLADYLSELLSNPTEAESMGTKAFAKLKMEFVWPIVADRLTAGIIHTLNARATT